MDLSRGLGPRAGECARMNEQGLRRSSRRQSRASARAQRVTIRAIWQRVSDYGRACARPALPRAARDSPPRHDSRRSKSSRSATPTRLRPR
jgi:hypothetical protein